MRYSISSADGLSRFIRIGAEFQVREREKVTLQLAAWRPGRYELGNFAKNIRSLQMYSQSGDPLHFHKITKDTWVVNCPNTEIIRISYEYFASELNAGSTYCGKDLLYVNPVNCLIYDTELMHEPHELQLNIPDHFDIACSLPKRGKRLFANHFDQLADAPLIAAPNLECFEFEMGNCRFFVWIRGRHTLDVQQFVVDAKKYTAEQLAVFGEFDSKEFHYLYHFLPTRAYHGVEHCDSTVIVMGPGDQFHQKDRYNDFLAISSHELFHYWNIKRIRPAEMLPYDFTKENYCRTGYVYEGVTTYYGDYMLLRSGAWNFADYLEEFNKDLQKHYDNEGRYHYSVADSSFDTWLDGYVPGIPGRKVSIYTEGMLAALMLDIEIRKSTQNMHNLDLVMAALYKRFYKQGKGYTAKDFQTLAEEYAGKSLQYFFDQFYEGRGQLEKYLPQALSLIGCEIVKEPSPLIHERRYGFRLSEGLKPVVTAIQDQSPAEYSGLSLGDEVLLINSTPVSQGVDWNNLFSRGGELLAWNTIEGTKTIELLPNGREFFQQYRMQKMSQATPEQKAFYTAWSKQPF